MDCDDSEGDNWIRFDPCGAYLYRVRRNRHAFLRFLRLRS